MIPFVTAFFTLTRLAPATVAEMPRTETLGPEMPAKTVESLRVTGKVTGTTTVAHLPYQVQDNGHQTQSYSDSPGSVQWVTLHPDPRRYSDT